MLDVVEVEKVLTKWVNNIVESRPDLKGCLDAVAIDGKTMRASQKSGAITSHLLSVVSHELGITLTQIGVCDKTNEIPISIEILDAFDVSNKVITTDALLTQKPFCQAILNAGGDYVLPVKMNQKSLFSAIEKLFQDTPDTADTDLRIHPVLGEPYDIHKTVEKAHGRLETRCLKASTSLNEYLDCPGVSQVFQYSYSCKDTGEEKHKIHYGITSLSLKKRQQNAYYLYGVDIGQ